ncbi:hypothetical protein DB29_01727 [Shouchella clausii]|nr:hypothetical protein DB29_01727 [Shouchella clausii]
MKSTKGNGSLSFFCPLPLQTFYKIFASLSLEINSLSLY